MPVFVNTIRLSNGEPGLSFSFDGKRYNIAFTDFIGAKFYFLPGGGILLQVYR